MMIDLATDAFAKHCNVILRSHYEMRQAAAAWRRSHTRRESRVKTQVLRCYRKAGFALYPSDVAAVLGLDPAVVRDACFELCREGRLRKGG